MSPNFDSRQLAKSYTTLPQPNIAIDENQCNVGPDGCQDLWDLYIGLQSIDVENTKMGVSNRFPVNLFPIPTRRWMGTTDTIWVGYNFDAFNARCTLFNDV